MTLVSAVLLALALWAATARGDGDARVAGIVTPRAPHPGNAPTTGQPGTAPGAGGSAPGAGGSAAERRTAAAACGLAGVAVLALVGGSAGITLGLAVSLGGPFLLRRLEPRAVREERERLAADLPLALDLLAACLAGGAALPAALLAVADAVGGPCGARLTQVAGGLAVGSAPAEAWLALLVGWDSGPGHELAASAARVLARSGDGGAPVVAAVHRLALDARGHARARGEQAAGRAGVLSVAPLGLCFLPAFVLLGVVPVIAGLVGPLLATF